METIFQFGRKYNKKPNKKRIASRALIFDRGMILLSHELNTGVFLTPGGGLEKDETLEECCKREVKEETGFIVNVGSQIFTVNEFYMDMVYVSNYFVCDIIGKGENALTENEKNHGVVAEWVKIEKALEIFGNYSTYAPINEELEAQYKREYTVITKALMK